jgi:hypothetical protein
MIVFFIRRQADIDHLTPVAYKVSQLDSVLPTIICMTPDLDIESDFRLQFLRQKGMTVKHAFEALPLSSLEKFSRKLGDWCQARLNIGALKNWFESKLGRGAWARRLIKRLKPAAVVFDWHEPEKSLAIYVQQAAKSQGIPIVAAPHGLQLMAGEFQRSQDDEMTPYGYYLRYADHVISPFLLETEWFKRCGVEPEKLVTLGSARFCSEWREMHNNLVSGPAFSRPTDAGKLKVVYMDHSAVYNLRPDIISQSLQSMAELDFIELAIKPSVTGRNFNARDLGNLANDTIDVPSTKLVDWADVVLGNVSSILIEPLMAGKILLYPTHHHDNKSLFEEFDTCWCVDDDQQLIAALTSLNTSPDQRPYEKVSVQNFLTKIVYGDVPDRDVLGDYARFILKAAVGSTTSVSSEL